MKYIGEDRDYKQYRLQFWKEYSYWIAVVFLIFFVLIFERNYFQKVEVKIRNALKEKRDVESIVLSYQLEERLLFRPQRVENIAKKTLKMKEPTSDRVIEVVIED